jgi:FkbM family methyltransferase
MGNALKDALKKTRDRFLADTSKALRQLDDKLDLVRNRVEAVEQALKETVSNQSYVRNELTRAYNSGAISLSDTEIVAKMFNGLKIYLDPRDISVTPHLALDGIWEEEMTMAWLSVLQPSDLVVDIGANFGYYGVLAAQQTERTKSRVVFFEANPALIPYIQKTLSVNWLREYSTVENMAVGDKEGVETLNILHDYIASSSLHSASHIDTYMHDKMNVSTASTVEVPATTLDAYCEKHDIEHIELVKMDIEGFEDKAYSGMREIVKASPGITMFVEFTKEAYRDPKQFYEQMLDDFGYIYVIEGGKVTRPPSPAYESIMDHTNTFIMLVLSKNGGLAGP